MSTVQLELNLAVSNTSLVEYNPRYLAYCRVHNRTPDEQLAYDIERWPGGKMCGFICWISAQWETWCKAANAKDGGRRGYNDPKLHDDHAELDARLATLGPCTGCAVCKNSPS